MKITIPINNPPGFNQWIGGQYRGDPAGIKVDKTDTKLLYTIDSSIDQLLTWYYDWGWYSGQALTGPWKMVQLSLYHQYLLLGILKTNFNLTFPSCSTLNACNKCCHRFISRACL